MLVFMTEAAQDTDRDFTAAILARAWPSIFTTDLLATHRAFVASQRRLGLDLLPIHNAYVAMIDRRAGERLAAYHLANGPSRQRPEPEQAGVTLTTDALTEMVTNAVKEGMRKSEPEQLPAAKVDLASWLASDLPAADKSPANAGDDLPPLCRGIEYHGIDSDPF
jgi:hypothetical protein